jgi:phosphate acetyltransferase
MQLIDKAKAAIKEKNKRLILPEGEDERIVAAAARLRSEGLAEPIVLAPTLPLPSRRHVEIVRRARPQMTDAMAERLLARPLHLAAAMLAAGDADAMLAGAAYPTSRVIEAALMTVGMVEGISLPSSFFLMQWSNRHLIFADCAVNVQPSAAELADIAIATARGAERLNGEPSRVAVLSFSTRGSGRHPDATKVLDAVRLVREREPDLAIEGEIQADAALIPEIAVRKIKDQSQVAGRANVLIFPDLDAGNIAYKLVQHLSGAQAVGPILQGFRKPLSDVSRGATTEEVVATATLLLAMA